MTYIEFFDKTAAENICACLVKIPDRVVLIGENIKSLEKHSKRYKWIFSERGHDVEFVCLVVNKSSMGDIIEKLSGVVETYEDCVFDLTGGDDLYLVAIGVISERYKDKNVQMHRFNIRNGRLIDCDMDGVTVSEGELPRMTVEENIRIYGGDIIDESERKDGSVAWQMDDDFRRDIDAMWSICRDNVRFWNAHIGVFEMAESLRDEDQPSLVTVASVKSITEELKAVGAKFIFIKSFVKRLSRLGLITEWECSEDVFRIQYKNEQVKKCLTKAGQALEMKIFSAALSAVDQDGLPVYNDVRNGVCIDWDGDIHTDGESYDTENEIDVLMMDGMVPVFVSCKNGRVGIDELYKLNTVAERFGGRYAKKVLVATALKYVEYANIFRQRAKDMGIRLVEDVQDMTDEKLIKEIKKFKA